MGALGRLVKRSHYTTYRVSDINISLIETVDLPCDRTGQVFKGYRMNEENNVDVSTDIVESVSSSETSDIDNGQEVHTSEPVQAQDYTELTEQVQQINQKMDNITNISIVCMVGVGMAVGMIACGIFARYFKS